MTGELHKTFQMPDEAAAEAALATMTADAQARRGQPFSANVWSLEDGGPQFVTILTERNARATLNKQAKMVRSLGGVECDAPEEVIRAQQEKRARGQRERPGTVDVQPYDRGGAWILADGRLDPR